MSLILSCISLAVLWPQWRAYLQGFGYPQVDSISPSSGPVGTIVAISGEHFGESLGTVTFGSQEATILFWNPTLIELIVPELEAGIYDVVVTTSVGGSNSVPFEIVDNDSDNDCLTDTEEETLGTDPDDPDTDGDGLLDGWEAAALDPDNNCNDLGLDLPGLGADPLHKDIFLEIDWMDANDHSHRPKDAALQIIIDAFANAPVDNPNGERGISLHIDVSNAVSHQGSTTFDIPLAGFVETQFDEIKTANFSPNRKPAYHYALFSHATARLLVSAGATGIAELYGNDLMVSLGGRANQEGTVEEQAGTLMHELGHNLNLRHGGGDSEACKPNYMSVMNYWFQLIGIPIHVSEGATITRFDYSHEALETLNEEHLDEMVGIRSQSHQNDITLYVCPGGPLIPPGDCRERGNFKPALSTGQIDWNCNGVDNEFDVEADINGDNLEDNLVGHNDWKSLKYDFQNNPGNFADGVHEDVVPPEDELDHETD
jgi:hypothetical protein